MIVMLSTPDFPKNYTYAMPGSWMSKVLRISGYASVTAVRKWPCFPEYLTLVNVFISAHVR
jgi:hypothetical protein